MNFMGRSGYHSTVLLEQPSVVLMPLIELEFNYSQLLSLIVVSTLSVQRKEL